MTSTAQAQEQTPASESTGPARHGVITTARLRANGLAASTIAHRCRPGGPWRRLFPGVVLLAPGEPTRRQLVQAAVEHAGPGAVLTGTDALRAHGLDVPTSRSVHVLIPAERRPLPPESVVLERTSRPPAAVPRDGLPCAPPVRAVLDAARRENDPEALRHLLGLNVYYGMSTVQQLREELAAGSQRGTAAVRTALRRLTHRQETFVHGIARRVIMRAPLPPPRWNVTVCTQRGAPIGSVDAWWDDIGFGWQFDVCRQHDPQARTGRLALTAAGVTVLHTPLERLRSDCAAVVRELAGAFRSASRRRPPRVYAMTELAAA